MKKIISTVIICAMLFAMLLTVVPTGASTLETLRELIASTEAFVQENYTKASWDNLTAALNAANRANSDTASAAAVKNACNQLDSAIKGLQVDTSALTELFAIADKFTEKHKYADKWGEYDVLDENGDYVMDENGNYVKDSPYVGDYSPENWKKIQDAISAAKSVETSNDLEAIKTATANLKDAIENTEYLQIDDATKVKLAELLELADVLEPFAAEKFADSAWGMVEIKVEKALKVGEEDYKISTYLEATSQLEMALKNLTEDKTLPVPFPLNYVNMDNIIDYIDIEFTEDMFTAETWAKLREAYDLAVKARETAKKQVEVDAAYEALKAAMEALELAPLPTQPAVTEAPATEAPATEAPAAAGCGGSVVATVAVVAVVSTLGVAVLRKKEN